MTWATCNFAWYCNQRCRFRGTEIYGPPINFAWGGPKDEPLNVYPMIVLFLKAYTVYSMFLLVLHV